MASNLLIVESPSKAKTLKKYLGKDFEILASYGHVRDLVPKTGAVDPEDNFRMKYELIDRNTKHVDAIARAVKDADTILLATKAHHTEAAARALRPYLSPSGCVVSAQNGLNELAIAAVVGEARTVGAFVNFGADYMEPGVIMYGGRGAFGVSASLAAEGRSDFGCGRPIASGLRAAFAALRFIAVNSRNPRESLDEDSAAPAAAQGRPDAGKKR